MKKTIVLRKRRYPVRIGLLIVLCALLIQALSAAAPLPGAIFTTLEDGTRVNANIYEDKRDVYLDGGPGPNAPQGAAGLPDGNYYFQVTEPSGKVLLSTDPVICREFRVEDGIIAEYVSIDREYVAHSGKCRSCAKDGWEEGRHDVGWDIDHNALTIQLMPYKNTPNKGGVYKVWATPIEHFDGDLTMVDNGYASGYFHGFIPAYSKTDNFKVIKHAQPKPTPQITVCKFEDSNGDGVQDAGEPSIAGWGIYVTDPLGVTNTYWTSEDGCLVLDAPIEGTWTTKEAVPADWSVTATIVDGAYVEPTNIVTIDVVYTTKESTIASVTFGNFHHFYVDGYKYEDMNGDGMWDEGDAGIEGWKISLYKDGMLYDTIYTNAAGYYEFYVCKGGNYKVVEEERDGWTATSPTSFEFTAISGQAQTFDFFNFELGQICGQKWYDLDRDGVMDAGEEFIEGFKIELYKDGMLYDTTFTDTNGIYCFSSLSHGTYEVREVLPNNPGDYLIWVQTYPSSGIWTFEMTSGFDKHDADFGNVVEFIGGLTWGYWKTHTGIDSPAMDPAYDLLPENPMPVDIVTPDGDYFVNDTVDAKFIFDGAGDYPASCSGNCRILFRAQLLALHMNLLKFSDMGNQIYMFESDPYSGMTIQYIYEAAIDKLNDGEEHNFVPFQETLDRINNNGHYAIGEHTLVKPTAPT